MVNRSRSARWVRAGPLAGLVGGAVELVIVLPSQASLGVMPGRMFQSIAGGLLGASTYVGGWQTIILGVICHFTIAVLAGLAYALAATQLPMLVRRPVLCGLGYGIIVYLVMTFVVLPLSAVPFHPTFKPVLAAISLSVHMVAFGLPIALMVRLLLASREAN